MPFVGLHCRTMVEHKQSGEPAGQTLHRPAMVAEVLQVLQPSPGDAVLDLTVGTGGHSLALARAVSPHGVLIGVDADPEALHVARRRLNEEAACRFELHSGRFSRAPEAAAGAGVRAFDCVLADLGVGSHQLDDPARGLSFDSAARLDMRYDPSVGQSAWDAVNGLSEEELAGIFHQLGEERYSRRIASAICEQRRQGPIETPAELADLVKRVVARRTPRRRTWRVHPATRVMMALRIYVNRELEELDALLEALPGLLRSGGRAAVLTYHSLEARRVKQAWRRQKQMGLLAPITRSPLRPTEQEQRENPRVRSAQLRAARKL
jgi:16S rRNA (cytosine1402-N4)-methyltransferase